MFKKIQYKILVLGIIVLALLMRIPLLDGSLWLDEAAQVLESERPFAQQFDIIPDFQPPLLHLLLHVGLYINDSVVWLRLIGSLIPALITIWATVQIGTILYRKKVGLLAGLLLSLSSFHIFYSQELRPYSLPAMFAVLTWLEILYIQKNNDDKSFVRFTFFTILGLYSSYLYPFLFIAQLVYALIYLRKSLVKFIFSTAAVTAAFVPWLPIFFRQLSAGSLVRQQLPGWSEVVSIPQLKSIPLVFLKFIYGVMDVGATPFFIITAILIFITVVIATSATLRQNTKQFIRDTTPLLLWLLIPLITSWVISFFIPVVQPKRVLFLLPAFVLLVSLLANKLIEHKNKIFSAVGVTMLLLFVAVSCVSVAQYWTQPKLQRENWKELQHEIAREYTPQSTVLLFSFPEAFASWQYYDRNTFPTFATGTLHINNAPNLSQRVKALSRYRYLLVFDYLRDLTDPDDVLLNELKALGYQEVEVIDYPNIGFVRVYTQPINTLTQK